MYLCPLPSVCIHVPVTVTKRMYTCTCDRCQVYVYMYKCPLPSVCIHALVTVTNCLYTCTCACYQVYVYMNLWLLPSVCIHVPVTVIKCMYTWICDCYQVYVYTWSISEISSAPASDWTHDRWNGRPGFNHLTTDHMYLCLLPSVCIHVPVTVTKCMYTCTWDRCQVYVYMYLWP
jgi:hypothetical protein